MIPKVANHLFLHTSRAVALVQNQSGALRNVLQSGPAAGAGSSWGSAGTGTGPGGAKFNAGSKFYKGYTGAGRAFTQANSSGTQDGATRADDEKEDIKLTFVTPRSTSSKVSRTLARRHSFSLPAGLNDNEISSSVLHAVQIHLRERHSQAAPPTKDQSPEVEPKSSSVSPFRSAMQRAISKRDANMVLKHVNWLISPSDEPSFSYAEPTIIEFNVAIRAMAELDMETTSDKFAKLYNTILECGLTPNLGTYIGLLKGLTDIDRHTRKSLRFIASTEKLNQLRGLALGGTGEDVNQRAKELLLKDNSFMTAMQIFDAACAHKAGTQLASFIPVYIYHALLRSCSAHGDVSAALRVYGQLETIFAAAARNASSESVESRTWKDPPTAPTDLMLFYLMGTYVTAGDLAGAKEVFSDFRQRTSQGLLQSEQPLQIRIWNKMIECYFKVGQPAGALRLLETMMDNGNDQGSDEQVVRDLSVPPPASSTFTAIIRGFCEPSSDVQGNVPRSDIKTALSWFDRLLQQPSSSQDPYEPTENPSRPDQVCWVTMLDALVQASFEDKGYLKDLNRLYDTFVQRAADDGLDIMAVDSLKIFGANVRVLQQLVNAREAGVQLDDVELLARDSSDFIGRHLSRLTDRPQAGNDVLAQLEKVLSVFVQTQSHTDGPSPTLIQLLGVIHVIGEFGSPPTPAIACSVLHAYVTAPAETQKTVSSSAMDAILSCALALPVEFSDSDAPNTSGCAYTGLMSLLQVMNDAEIGFIGVSGKTRSAVIEALYSTYSERDVSRFLDGLGPSFQVLRMPLAEQGDAPRPLTPPSPPADFPSTYVIVDADLSRQVDQWFPSNPTVTVHDGYKAMHAAISSKNPRYPHPATLARLISGLGRAGDIAAAKDVYCVAQQVLFSPYVAQSPAWQSQSWFQLEDSMISAYAHVGDMNAAFAHRDRITAAGGIPSPDAYGSLIECVKDTTDDTSNAMALFTECQMLGIKPNVYLYNTIISKLAKARKADFALELFQQMKANASLRPSSITYGAVIAACARVGDAAAAEQLFEEMASQPNFKPRVPPYNTMMQMYTHTKPDRTKVLYYFDKMKEAKVYPSAHTYKLLIDAYGTIEPVDLPAMEKTFKDIETNPKVRLQGAHWAALINAYGCVLKDLDKAIGVFESISSHPASVHASLPDAVAYESLINVLVTHKRMDLAQQYLDRLQSSGVHMTAYIANLVIKGYAAEGAIEQARSVFESLADPPSGVAAPGNHVPHDSASSSPVSPPGSVSYREPSTWEAMFRAELGNGDRDRAVALLERLRQRQFPEAVYNRIRGIMLDDSVAPWSQSPSPEQSPSASP